MFVFFPVTGGFHGNFWPLELMIKRFHGNMESVDLLETTTCMCHCIRNVDCQYQGRI